MSSDVGPLLRIYVINAYLLLNGQWQHIIYIYILFLYMLSLQCSADADILHQYLHQIRDKIQENKRVVLT